MMMMNTVMITCLDNVWCTDWINIGSHLKVRHVGDLGNVHTDRFGHTKIRVNDRQVIIIITIRDIIIAICHGSC